MTGCYMDGGAIVGTPEWKEFEERCKQRLEDDGAPPLEFDRERYEAEDIVSKLETRARIRRELKRGTRGRDRIAELLDEAAAEIKRLRNVR